MEITNQEVYAHTCRVLRQQAWERAKAELRSMGVTFHSAYGAGTASKYCKLDALIEGFVKSVEDDELHC